MAGNTPHCSREKVAIARLHALLREENAALWKGQARNRLSAAATYLHNARHSALINHCVAARGWLRRSRAQLTAARYSEKHARWLLPRERRGRPYEDD